MNYPNYWEKAIAYLAESDRILADIIAGYPDESLKKNNNPFGTLVKAIVGQQISVKAAAKISERLESNIGEFLPQIYLNASEESLKKCGLSRQKIRYITNVANAFFRGTLRPENWENMTDWELEKQLTSISGIGTWTAQMFIIFHLNRPDILPLSDLGLLKAVAIHYNFGDRTSKIEVETIANQWRPYRTVATWYLWRSLDPHPVQY